MSLYQRRYYQQNKERIKANYLRDKSRFLRYKREYYQKNKETISLKTSVREKLNKYGLCPVLVLASLRSSIKQYGE
jgi:hypothetical protein